MPDTPSARGMTATCVPWGGSHTKYCGSTRIRSQSEIIGENVKIRCSRVTSQSCIIDEYGASKRCSRVISPLGAIS